MPDRAEKGGGQNYLLPATLCQKASMLSTKVLPDRKEGRVDDSIGWFAMMHDRKMNDRMNDRSLH